MEFSGWQAEVIPETLEITAIDLVTKERVHMADALTEPLEISPVQNNPDGSLSWGWPDLHLQVQMKPHPKENRLQIQLVSTVEQNIQWPKNSQLAEDGQWIVPLSEGLAFPAHDEVWRKRIADRTAAAARDPAQRAQGNSGWCLTSHGQLSLPFWAYRSTNKTMTFMVPRDLQTDVCFTAPGQGVVAGATHHFVKREGLGPYEVVLTLSGSSMIDSARQYRSWADSQGEIKTLQKKQAANGNTELLFGATHFYLWGDGNTVTALKSLYQLGFRRAALFYDADYISDQKAAQLVAAAKGLGYLIGPYDSFGDLQPTEKADGRASKWEEGLYPGACIVLADGKVKRDSSGHGCALSSQALRIQEPMHHNLDRRIGDFAKLKINAYFLDADSVGHLQDDYSSTHPMTMKMDQENRRNRLHKIGIDYGLVVGSETAAAWATDLLHFTHGPHTLNTDATFRWLSNKDVFGGWSPPARPAIFFKEITATPEMEQELFDLRYRIPLYQAALHDVVVSTDRREFSIPKFTNLMKRRQLLGLLYGVPELWNLDQKQIAQYGNALKRYNDFFLPLHQEIATQPLTEFQVLSRDSQVQRSCFGTDLQITANFSTTPFQGIGAQCVQAFWLKTGQQKQFCP
jgi:hypothetical protein